MDKSASVITMNTDSHRLRAFAANNRYLDYIIFQGISGKHIAKEDRIAGGLVTPQMAETDMITDVRLGTAISHWSLWREAIKTNSGELIMEDDVMTHPLIWSTIENSEHLEALDALFFSCNTNTSITMRSPEGVLLSCICDPANPHPDWINATLARTSVEDVRYWRLHRAFELCCYFVTPVGGRKLANSMFPLTLEESFVPLVGPVAGSTINHRMNALYDDMNVFISMPFLADTPHHNEFAPV